MAAWSKRWNIKMNEDSAQAVYFSHELDHLNLFLQWMQATFIL
jgi:hypothetical protein